MPHVQITGKRLQISKANTTMIIVVAVASFVVAFSLVASRALLSQRSYQSRVIEKKEQARNTLNQNIENVEKLRVAYQEFTGAADNVIGGNPSGSGDRDGDNAKIVLDALPSKYDFPGLATSLEKLVKTKNVNLGGITGTDDEVAQGANQGGATPTPVEMPFQVQLSVGSYAALRDTLQLFERSIKPIKVQKLAISGTDEALDVDITAVTFYQPAKTLEIKKEVVK